MDNVLTGPVATTLLPSNRSLAYFVHTYDSDVVIPSMLRYELERQALHGPSYLGLRISRNSRVTGAGYKLLAYA